MCTLLFSQTTVIIPDYHDAVFHNKLHIQICGAKRQVPTTLRTCLLKSLEEQECEIVKIR